MTQRARTGSRALTFAVAVAAMIPVLGILSHPEPVFRASIGGLELWWKIVFPALLPYLVLIDVMRGYGVFQSLGRPFEGWMRRAFGLPGEAAFCLWLGAAAGQPSAATVVADLSKAGRLTRSQGERLLSLSHLSSPAVIVTVVGVGCFGSWRTGAWLAAIHFASALLAGIALTGSRRGLPPSGIAAEASPAPDRTAPSLGRLLGEAVSSSVQRLFLLGSYMMLAAVSLELLRQTGWISRTGSGLPETAAAAFADSLIGALAASRLGSPQAAAAIASFALAWGGLSSHAQTFSMTIGTGLRYAPYAAGRLLHGLIAAAAAWLLWPISGDRSASATGVFAYAPAGSSGSGPLWETATAAAPLFWIVSAGFAVFCALACGLLGLPHRRKRDNAR